MKTVSDITKEKETLLEEFKTQEGFSDHELQQARKKAEFLTKCLYYLEGNPSTEGLNDQLQWVKERLTFIENGFQSWYDIQPNAHQIQKPEAQYRKEMRHKELKYQLKALNYILT